MLTPASVSLRVYSVSAGIVSSSVLAVLLTRGTAEAKINMAMKHDANGS